MLHVPYRGAGPALNDLIPGRVDVMFNNIGAVLPLIQGGKLRGLAVTTAKRTPAAPQSAADRGGRRAGLRRVVLVRDLCAGEDAAAIIRKMHADIVAALNDPDHQDRGSTARRRRSSARRRRSWARISRREMDKWGPVIKEAGIKGDE